MTIADLQWVTGFLEGEGSFRMSAGTGTTPMIEACQVQKWPVEKLQSMFGGYLALRPRSTKDRGGPIWRWNLVGSKAAALMLTIYSMLSPRRQGQILSALTVWRFRSPRNAVKVQCIHGHPFDEVNTRWYKGKRWCRACKRQRLIRWISSGRPVNGNNTRTVD